MKLTKKLFAIALATVVAVQTVGPVQAASSVKISKSKVTLYEGKSTTLTVKKGSKKVSGVKWSTSNKKVATVSSKGKVTERLDRDIAVYPGHGYPTTIDEELKTNPYLR
ncbi:MAG: Ig-like domain-containing protein [Lachnospiraceae bacterium]|nr:Ig-like domain-containing protein [Lachnospiraceae bacterium]